MPYSRDHSTQLPKGTKISSNVRLPLFDKMIVAIGVNADKKYMFSLEERKEWIKQTFMFENKVEVAHYEGLTVNFCRQGGASHIIRGLRNAEDFQFENLSLK